MRGRIGIDMGGTAIKAGLVAEDFTISCRMSRPTGTGFLEVVREMADLAFAVAEAAGCSITDFPAVGVGTPSCISPKTGRLVFSNNTNWKDVPLREELERLIPVPVSIGNDANCAIIGETLAGGAKGHENVLMLTLGTGVGGGVILGGKLFAGADGMGAELGHTPLVSGGVRCTCGIAGCLESYASATGLIRMTREAMEAHPESAMCAMAQERGRVSARTAYDCARAGDPAAQAVVDRYEEYLANGIGGLINIFRPEIVLIGGGISNEGENLLVPLREKLKKYVFASDVIGVPPVQRAVLGNDAGTIGAAYLDTM